MASYLTRAITWFFKNRIPKPPWEARSFAQIRTRSHLSRWRLSFFFISARLYASSWTRLLYFAFVTEVVAILTLCVPLAMRVVWTLTSFLCGPLSLKSSVGSVFLNSDIYLNASGASPWPVDESPLFSGCSLRPCRRCVRFESRLPSVTTVVCDLIGP
jgi:hypothetical protein